jgi:virulence-associated protein VapD
MFAIAFDLIVAETANRHPKGISQAYSDIAACLSRYGFDRVQGSLYITPKDDLANLFSAIQALKALPWFPSSVRDIRAFKVEHWSDFTQLVKTP